MDNLLDGELHCDGYYFNGVCPARGEPDMADIRHDKDGFVRPPRHFCLSHGQSPLEDYELCRHCLELRRFFRKPRRKLVETVHR